MPLKIELSEQGSLSQIIRGAELAMALDQNDGTMLRCDFEGGPWRHLLSGAQQLHIRKLVHETDSDVLDGNFAPSPITSVWLRPAHLLPTYPPDKAWLVTTGGTPQDAPAGMDAWTAHVQAVAPGYVPANTGAAARLPTAICTKTFAKRSVAPEGIVVIGCGTPEADWQMAMWLRAICAERVVLFDIYTQHTLRALPEGVELAALLPPAGRAKLYTSCRYVISGSFATLIDDHFVHEAIYLGLLPFMWLSNTSDKPREWNETMLSQRWSHLNAAAEQHEAALDVMDVHAQAKQIRGLIDAYADIAPWTAPQITQLCAPPKIPTDAHVAWIDCGQAAQWEDNIAMWLCQSHYSVIYVDISHNALLLSSIFTVLLTQQLRDRTKPMPHVQGINTLQELEQLCERHLSAHPTHQLDVVHLQCALPKVLQTRKHLEKISQTLIKAPNLSTPTAPPAKPPMVVFNNNRPADTTRLSTLKLGAPVASAGVFQGIMRCAERQLSGVWFRTTALQTVFARVYYYPFDLSPLQNHDEIDVPQLRQGLIDGEVDVIMTGGPLMANLLYARRLWATKAVPIVAMLHSLHSLHGQLETLAQVLLTTSIESDVFVSPTECGKRAYQKLLDSASDAIFDRTNVRMTYKGRMVVVPYGIDTSWYQNLHQASCRELLRLPHERVIFLSFGRFNRAEKFDLLPVLIALKNLVQAGHNPLLLLAGSSKEKGYTDELRSAAAAMHLDAYVELREDVDAKHKPYFYGASDIFISPSDNIQETYGLTVVEAMAASLPVIASRWDGYRELVVDGVTGMLIPTHWTDIPKDLMAQLTVTATISGYGHRDLHESIAMDIERLTESMSQLYLDDSTRQRMGKAGLMHCRAHFELRHQSQKMVDILMRCAKESLLEPWPAMDKTTAPYIDDVSTRFAHYTQDHITPDAWVSLTALVDDEELLTQVLCAAKLGDRHEESKIHRAIAQLRERPLQIASLEQSGICPMRALRCLKYGIFRIAA